jgi:hypothetical protein
MRASENTNWIDAQTSRNGLNALRLTLRAQPRSSQMIVGQAFLPAGAGDFPVASSENTRPGGLVN